MAPNGTKGIKTAQNGTKGTRTARNGTKRFTTAQKEAVKNFVIGFVSKDGGRELGGVWEDTGSIK